MRRRVLAGTVAFGLIVAMVGVAAAAMFDFGVFRDNELRHKATMLFGVQQPLSASATDTAPLATATANSARLATFAKGLHARVVTQGVAAPNLDQIALWPDDVHPTHLIVCNEQDAGDPGLQSIDISTGDVTTLVTGTTECDPVRRTTWGTILFGEEAGGGPAGGRVYELIDPLEVHDVLLDRDTGTFRDGVGADHFVARPALGRLSFEGLGILQNGVVYFGDENRPLNGIGGGAIFKFIPAFLREMSAGPIASLDDSPLAAGAIFGLRLACGAAPRTTGKERTKGSAGGCRSRRPRTPTCDRRPRTRT